MSDIVELVEERTVQITKSDHEKLMYLKKREQTAIEKWEPNERFSYRDLFLKDKTEYIYVMKKREEIAKIKTSNYKKDINKTLKKIKKIK